MCLEPLIDAVHVKVMSTLTLYGCAVLPRVLALRTGHLEGVHTDDAVGIGDVPVPGGHGEPRVKCDFHFLNYLQFQYSS